MLNHTDRLTNLYGKIGEYRKYYALYLLLGALMGFNLYLDTVCETEVIVPRDYIISRDQVATIQPDLVTMRLFATDNRTLGTTDDYQCQSNKDCNHGVCEKDTNLNGTVIGSTCDCSDGYITAKNSYCSYRQLSGLTALLLSIFLGGCGVDRCFMARGDSCAVCLGVLKGITFGGIGIWWLVDVILIGTGDLNDGNGYPLQPI